MKIAFVGGTRFIGHTAAALAVEHGHDVSLLHRGEHPSYVDGAAELLVDRSDPHALIAALEKTGAEAMVDTRAMTRPEAEVTAMAAKILGLGCVVLSSQDVYAQFGRLLGHRAPAPEDVVRETSPLTVPYPFRGIHDHEGGEDYDKKHVEEAFEKATGGLPSAIMLRLPATYGTRDPDRRFGWALDPLDAGEEELPRVGGATWRWTHAHVRDVAHAIVLACEKLPDGYRVYNLGEAVTPTMGERVEALADYAGLSFRWREVESLEDSPFRYLGEMANDFVSSSERIRSELGFSEITTAGERLADLVSWLRRSR